MGYSPWGCEESDVTEVTNTLTSLSVLFFLFLLCTVENLLSPINEHVCVCVCESHAKLRLSCSSLVQSRPTL